MIGDPTTAEQIAAYHHGSESALPDGCDQIGSGSQRTVYVDYVADVVYKIGDDRANRQEVRTLTSLRRRGAQHAPPATLYEVQVADLFGYLTACSVVAMPYLPDDGSVPRPYPILEGAADLNPHGNVHANRGRLWLIDAGGL